MDETLKIFILDNVKSIRARIKLLLNTNKYTVYEAESATELFNSWQQNGHSADLIIYDSLKDIFWDTDIFIRYESQNFIGVFPFASAENKDIISGKVDACFHDLKLKEPKFKDYYLSNVFVTYPQDIKEDEDVFSVLLEKTKKVIKDKDVKKDKKVVNDTTRDLSEYHLAPRIY
jgi:CheY-like chemotaxis protein